MGVWPMTATLAGSTDSLGTLFLEGSESELRMPPCLTKNEFALQIELHNKVLDFNSRLICRRLVGQVDTLGVRIPKCETQ